MRLFRVLYMNVANRWGGMEHSVCLCLVSMYAKRHGTNSMPNTVHADEMLNMFPDLGLHSTEEVHDTGEDNKQDTTSRAKPKDLR